MTRVVCTHFNQDGKIQTTMNMSNRLVGCPENKRVKQAYIYIYLQNTSARTGNYTDQTDLAMMLILICGYTNNTNNPSNKSVVLESSVKPSLVCLLWFGLTEDSRTSDSGCRFVADKHNACIVWSMQDHSQNPGISQGALNWYK